MQAGNRLMKQVSLTVQQNSGVLEQQLFEAQSEKVLSGLHSETTPLVKSHPEISKHKL